MAHSNFAVSIPGDRYDEIFKPRPFVILKNLYGRFSFKLANYYIEKYIYNKHSGKGTYRWDKELEVFMKISSKTPAGIDSPTRWKRWHTMNPKSFRPGQLSALQQRAKDVKECKKSRYGAELAKEKGIRIPEYFNDWEGKSNGRQTGSDVMER